MRNNKFVTFSTFAKVFENLCDPCLYMRKSYSQEIFSENLAKIKKTGA